jgi:ATP-binding cassette subfamily G (WHITE) protein 2 (SNQ2)
MSFILSVALVNQLQVPFIDMRNIYEIRERPSRMYSWTALVTSQMPIGSPFNIIGSSLYFLCFYWTVGLASDRAGYTHLIIGVIFSIYYGTFGQAVASTTLDASIAILLFSVFFPFVITL